MIIPVRCFTCGKVSQLPPPLSAFSPTLAPASDPCLGAPAGSLFRSPGFSSSVVVFSIGSNPSNFFGFFVWRRWSGTSGMHTSNSSRRTMTRSRLSFPNQWLSPLIKNLYLYDVTFLCWITSFLCVFGSGNAFGGNLGFVGVCGCTL